MATAEPVVATDQAALASSKTVAVVEEKPARKVGRPKKVMETKAKEPTGAKKVAKPSSHPPYYEMIQEAIVALKERSGSSQIAIAKFIEDKHKVLPSKFRKLLLTQLKKLVASGKLIKVKSSFKLSPVRTSATKPASTAPITKKVAAVLKSKASVKSVKDKVPVKAKASVPKPKAIALKPKVVAAKPKTGASSKAVAAKPKATASKRKSAVKPNLKEKSAKVARTSTRTSPGRKAAAPKSVARKVPAKKPSVRTVKPKTVKSPAKKAAAKKGKK